MGLLLQFIENEPGSGHSLRSNVCLISQVPPSESKWQAEPVEYRVFSRRKFGDFQGKAVNNCGWDAVTSGSPAFSADDWGGPLPNSSFWKSNLDSGVFPGKVSAFMSQQDQTTGKWRAGVRRHTSDSVHHLGQLSSHLCSSQHRHQAHLRPTQCTAGCDEGRPSPLQMPLPAALGTGSCWNRESWEE